MGETGDCLLFIIALSVPLSAALILMLRRAYSLAPGLAAAMAGLASAAAAATLLNFFRPYDNNPPDDIRLGSVAATLLNFFHPYDAAATDLTVHLVAVGIVVLALRAVGARALRDFPA